MNITVSKKPTSDKVVQGSRVIKKPVKASDSSIQEAKEYIRSAIDIMGSTLIAGNNDPVIRDAIANLGVVLLDIS